MEALQHFLNDGITAWFILASGVLLIILTLDRFYFLFFKVQNAAATTMGAITQSVLRRNYTEAIQICNSSENVPQFTVIKAGLMAVDSGREAMKASLGSQVVEISKQCEKRVPLIALIASVATLLGLLGTISGLMKTFASLASADPAKKGEMLGKGISEAMTATAGGLIVGIIAMVVHTICTTKLDEIVGGSQKAGFDIINLVEKSERGE